MKTITRILLFIAFILLFITCINSNKKDYSQLNINQEIDKNINNRQPDSLKSILDCITDLLLSSDLKVLNDWPKESIYIYSEEYQECDNFIYCFRVLSAPDPKETEVNAATIAMLCYNAKERMFYDASSDSDTVLNLEYDKNLEIKLLQKIRNTCPSFAKSEKKKSNDSINKSVIHFTNLPFNFEDYFEWQLNVDMGEAENDEKYPKNYLEDNKSFQEEYNSYFGNDTIPHFYYMFNTSKQFNTVLMVCSVKNKAVLFYKIITMKNTQIVNQFTIYTHNTGKLSDNFKISKDLHITKYLSGDIESKYQIGDDGKIMKEI